MWRRTCFISYYETFQGLDSVKMLFTHHYRGSNFEWLSSHHVLAGWDISSGLPLLSVERDQHQQRTINQSCVVWIVFCKCHALTTHYKGSPRQPALLEYTYTNALNLLMLGKELVTLENMNPGFWIYLKTHKKFNIEVLTKHTDTRLLPRFRFLVLNSYHSFHSCTAVLHRLSLLSFHEKMGTPWTNRNELPCPSGQFQEQSEDWR